MSTAEDYAWFENTERGLALESCLTFVKGLTAEDVIGRIGGAVVGQMTGLTRLEQYLEAVTVPTEANGEDGSFHYEARTGWDFAAVADLPGGALMLEQYGFLGITEEISRPLSQGTSLAVVYSSENNDASFVWARDGEVRVSFDPYSAAWREGSEPDALLAEMRRLDFNFSSAGVDDPGWVFDENAPGRAFALAEHVTGIRFTEDALTEPTYFAVSVPSPFWQATHAEAPVDPVPPIRLADTSPWASRDETLYPFTGDVVAAEIGQSITFDPFPSLGYDAALRYTVRTVEQARHAFAEPGDDPSVWLLVDVQAIGIRGRTEAKSTDFAFVGADGHRYRPWSMNKAEELENTALQPGEKTSGLVLFNVPPLAPANGKIVVVTVPYDIPVGYWSIDRPPARYRGPERYPG